MTENGPIFTVEITKPALKELAKINRGDQKALKKAIERLGDDPYPPGNKKLQDSGGERRIRVGNYRVIYVVEHDVVRVLVLAIGHRREIYQ